MLIPLPNLRHFFGKGGIPNPNKLFNFSLSYNRGANPLYNGNISETKWRTANSDSSLKSYAYSYDALNRITGATDNTGKYNLSGITYDKMGNILTLIRKGHTNVAESTFGVMDNLSYAYDIGNKLIRVTDAITTPTLMKGEFKDRNKGSVDYVYDDNGNMTEDKNKGITAISYNHLNLPTQVTINNSSENGSIQYVYDATGMKLEKKVIESGKPDVVTHYAGNYIYKNHNLEFFNHAEGYVTKDGNGYNYVYQYKDHLGNIRLSYKDANQNEDTQPVDVVIVDEKNYYPFGLRHKGYNNVINGTEHPYDYQAKENQKELGLNWHDFGARNYDASLGRWMNIDPLAEDFNDVSPYNTMLNDPINYIDPDGRSARWVPDSEGNLIAEAGDNAQTLADYQDISYSEGLKQLTDQGYTLNSKGILNLKIGDKVELDNVFTESIQNSTSDFDTDAFLDYKATGKVTGTGPTPEDKYNCWGSACAGSQGKKIELGVGIPAGSTFDANLTSDYTATTGANAQFGKNVLRFADGGNNVQHGAVFYGKSKNGTTYVYTKNGWAIKPEVMKLSDLQSKIPSYGTVQGINTSESGYYDPK